MDFAGQMYDRYVFWLVVAIKREGDIVVAMELPQIYVVELEEIEKTGDEDGEPKWTFNFGEIDEADWQELAQTRGDFNSAGLELITDQPVDRFEAFWHTTRPHSTPPSQDAIALKAPLRFLGGT
jgi:hypothetical protein